MKATYALLTSTGLALMSAGFLASATIPARGQEAERPILTADQCSPLTEANYQLCCIAQNRDQILTAGQIEQCPPLSTALIRNVFSTTSTNGVTGGNGGGGNGGGGGGGRWRR